MKDYLVLSNEGNVKILDIPNNISKSKIIEIARRVICETIKPVSQLNNIVTYVNNEIEFFERVYFEGKFPKVFCTTVYYEDYK